MTIDSGLLFLIVLLMCGTAIAIAYITRGPR